MVKPLRERDWIGPSILITVGLLVLLNNLGYLTWPNWAQMIRFWPVLLILAGVMLMIGGRAHGYLRWIVWIGVLSVLLWGVSETVKVGRDIQTFNSGWGSTVKQYDTETEGRENDAKSVDLSFYYGSARVKLESAQNGMSVGMHSEIRDGSGQPRFEKSWDGEILRLVFRQSGGRLAWFSPLNNHYDIRLGRLRVPYRIALEVGSGEADLDPGPITLENGDFKVGSGQLSGEFTERTPPSGAPLTLAIGSGRMTLAGLGFLKPSTVDATVGSGLADIGFKGLEKKDGCKLRLSVGSGSTVVRIPKGILWRVHGMIGSGNVIVDGKSVGHNGTFDTGVSTEGPAGLDMEFNVGSGTVELIAE